MKKESEEKRETLKQAFDQAAEHLVRLESEQQDWAAREVELSDQLGIAEEEIELLRGEKDELQKLSE